jgi:hypothetical protein
MLGAFSQFMWGCVHDVEKADGRSAAENYEFDVVFFGFETGGRIGGTICEDIGVEAQPGAEKGNFRGREPGLGISIL